MKTTKILIVLSILFIVVVSGCSKQKQDTTQKEPTETTGQAVDSLDKDLGDVDSLDADSDLGSLDDLDKDLDVGF